MTKEAPTPTQDPNAENTEARKSFISKGKNKLVEVAPGLSAIFIPETLVKSKGFEKRRENEGPIDWRVRLWKENKKKPSGLSRHTETTSQAPESDLPESVNSERLLNTEGLLNPDGRYSIAEYISFPEGEGAFAEKREEYFDSFLKEDSRIVETLKMGGLLEGKGSENWKNLAEHNIMAGVIARKLGELLGLPKKELEEVTFLGGIHDWDKRKDFKKAEKSAEIVDGIEVIKWDRNIIAISERSKDGPLSVTGNDLRGYEDGDWDWTRKILRFTDSSLMSTKDFKHNKVVSIEDRFKELTERIGIRSPGYNEEEGRKIYGEGKLLFPELERISGLVEGEIHQKILAEHPELAEKYPEQGSLYQLVTDKIVEEIDAIDEVDAIQPEAEPVTIFDRTTTTAS